ncbi:Tetratricopeptide-like helical [Akanthomyces lecanii RCEF 1005]|uniref:Tetratricopeptide-like helical n=1 Tax=Akanthomyces lecanii RCEF 1005 TaxID=1081108 RepID=A0A168I5L7_CORDF|nr:Tetratricopeptide-like helical [Akanthomyces lecanii RCEF 1005]
MEQGSKLLRYYLPESQASSRSADSLCCQLSAEVQGLPLLLVGVAGHIVDSSLSLSETLDDLRESWTNSNNIIENISPESATFQYQRPIHTAFNMSLSRLNPAARNVLRIMSMLSPVGILEEIVCSDLEEHSLSFLGYQNKPRFRREIRSQLVARHLIEIHESDPGPTLYRLHRQIQWKMLMDLKEDITAQQKVFHQAVALIVKVLPPLSEYMTPMTREWGSYSKAIGHVIQLHKVYVSSTQAENPIRADISFATLLASAGNYLYEINIAESAIALLATSADICHTLRAGNLESPSDTLQVSKPPINELLKLEATAMTIQWGLLSRNAGLSGAQTAMAYISTVLQLREEHSWMNLTAEERFWSNLLLSNAYNDVACQMINMHRYAEAEDLLRRSLSLKDTLSKAQHVPPFEFAESRNNLAWTHLGQGRIKEALQQSSQAVQLIDTADGDANDHTRFTFCFGACVFWAGQLEEALEVFENVYRCRVTTLSKSAWVSRDAAYAVALLLFQLGRTSEAK